jgi:hypothetical protein
MANESFSYEEAFGLNSETQGSPDQGSGFSYEEAFGSPPAKEAAAPGFFPTIKRTGGQMLTTAATAAEDVVGPNAVTRAVHDTGQGIIDRNPAGIRRLRDLIDSPVLAVKEAVGQFAPQIGAAAAGGFAGARAGGAIGALAGPGGAATGALIGGAAGSLLPIFTQEYGGIRQEQKEAGQEDKARALAAAIPATALERVGMGKALNVLKGVPVGAGSVLKEAGKGVLREGATEGAQNVIEQWGAFKDPSTVENLEDTALSAAMGGIGGGVVNGATGAVDGARSRAQERQRAQAEEQARGRAIEAAESADQLSTEASIENLAGAPINSVDRGEPATFEDLVTPRPQEEPDPFTAWEQEAVARQAADKLERERQARAAGVDYQPGDATPQWDTTPGAVSARGGDLEMPAPDFDTGSLGLESTSRALTPSQRMGIDPAAGPVSKVAAIAADSAPASDAQFIAATGRDLVPRRTGPSVTDESNVIDVQGRVVEDAAIGTGGRAPAQDGPINRTGQPLRLNAANALRMQAREAGMATAVVPHASGRGYDVVPRLPASAVVAAPDGAPFATPGAAMAELQRQQLGATHRIGPAGGDSSLGFVLEKYEENQAPALMQSPGIATESGANRAPNWRTNAMQAGRVARDLGFDSRGKRLAQVVAEIDAADARSVAVPSGANLANLHEANGPYPPSAATRADDGRWLPAVKSGPSGGQPISWAPTFSDAGSAAAWAGYEQAKAREGANVVALQRLQDAIPGRAETTGAPDAVPPRNLRLADERAPGAADPAQDGAGGPGAGAAPAVGTGQRAGSGTAKPGAAVRTAVPDAGGAGQPAGGVVGEGADRPAKTATGDDGRARFTVSIPVFGDVPYRASAPVDAGDGQVVSSRVITTRTKLTAANAQSLGLPKDKGTVYAWRVSVIRRADGAAHSVIEAMAADHGRSPDGEVLARFKPVENAESVGRIAPAVAKVAMMDWEAAALDGKAQAATRSAANSNAPGPSTPGAAAPRPAARIDDFGETLHGARKMLYAEAYADGMAQAKELDTKAHPLSKTWLEPDYLKLLEGGAPVEAVSLARALREAVPNKPQSAWKLNGWAAKVEALRGFAEDVLAGRMDIKTVEDAMQRAGSRDVANKAALYVAMGHERSLKGIDISEERYSMYDRVEYNPPRVIWSVSREAKGSAFGNWPRELAKGDTREAAIAAFKQRAAELLAEDQAPTKGATFEIYSKRAGGAREFFIGKKIGRKVAELKAGFADLKAAREYKAAHQSELEDLLAKYKAVPPVRSAQNAPRIGEDYRKGADVTPEQFQDAFGFRGVQFGNYVEGARRQQDLNRAYDALMDLAGVLGLPPRALSLGGRLGLAFGARGTGGTDAAAAHYEPTTVVINLTKREGAGSLAHEWWHGLDNYFSRQRGDGGSFMTTDSRSGDGVREEMRAAFREVVSSINRTGMQERSRKLDDRRTKEYWTTKPEMSARAFESYVIAKLQDQNAGNDYLANVVGDAMFALEGAYPYPTAGELPQIREGFDAFFQTVETREGDGGATVLYNTSDSAPPARGLSLEQAQQAVQQALAGLRNAPPVDIVGRSKEVWVDAPDSAMGAAIPSERRIVIAASAHGSADAVVETLFHEMFHLGLRNVLPASDYVQSMLDLAKRDSRVQEYANKWKKEAPEAAQQLQALRQRGHTGSELTAQYEALAIEEGLAVVAEELRAQKQAGTRLGMRVRVLAGWLAGVAERMGMQRLADRIRKMTYNEAERFVLKAIEHAGRAPSNRGNADVPRYRAGDQLETPAFRDWFGDSKVVDGAGQPLRVFHGTGGDFNAFSRDRAGATTGAANAGMGFFFTDRPEVAGNYARMAGDAQNILPVYLSLKNPLRLEAKNMMEADRMLQSGLQEKHDGAIIQVAMRDGGTQTVYMARESGQAKSAIGNRGTFDAGNPDIRYRTARAPVESSMGQMTAVQERVWKKVAGVARVPTLQERAKALTQNIGVRAKQALVDQFAPIQDVSQEAYMLARMSKGADGTMEAAMLYGRPYLRDGVPDVDVKDGGFAKVLASLKGEHDRFLWWVAAQRADRLKAEGKENLMSIDDIGVLKTLNADTMADGTQRASVYAKAAADLMAFNEAALKMAMESGLIDQAAYDIMKEQPYVPFYRLMAEDGGMPGTRFSSGLTNQNFAKKLKGGTEQLNADLLENLLLNWSHLYAATARNRAAVATMDAAEKMGVAYPVLEPMKGSVRVMRDGQAQHWMVEDPYLLEAISALHYTSSPLMKPLAKMKQLLTWGVTVNPTFKIRNLMRDSLAAIAQSDLGYNPGANVKRGWKLTAQDSQVYASMLASGGVIKFGTQENTERAREQVKKLGGVVLDQQGWHKLSGQLTTVWNAYSELGDRLENVNRVALYDRLVAQGHSHAEASFMARDLMDFSMSGNHAVVRFLTQSVPFLNARLQGLYKLGRAAHDNPRRFAAVAGAVSLASLALLAAFGDDEDWKKREDWDRDSYWWFKIGDQAYRIPKPFEVGAIGTLAERTAELMFSDEMTNRRFMERLGHMLAQTFSFDPMPQAFKPLVDIYSNQDSFTGRAIESQADQRLRPEDRYDERTSEVARLLGSWGLPDPVRFLKGEWSELSPKQVDHLLRGYFSWAGTTAAAVADTIARPALDRGARPDQRLKDVFVLGNFVESLPSGSSRYVTQMYEQARQVEQAHASYRDAIKRGDLEKAEEIQRDEAPKLRQRPAYANATRQLSDLNQRAKAVTASKELSGAEKRAALDAIERQRAEVGHRMNALAIAP